MVALHSPDTRTNKMMTDVDLICAVSHNPSEDSMILDDQFTFRLLIERERLSFLTID